MAQIRGTPGVTKLATPFYARERFQMEGATLPALPKNKYLYLVKFIRNKAFRDESRFQGWEDNISFLVKNVDRPQFQFDVEIKNQYNKKRVIQKNITYRSSSLSFYDTTDERVLSMIRDYMEFYYGDFSNDDRNAWVPDQVEGVFHKPNGWGFIPPSGTPDKSYFFEAISVYQFAAGCYTHWEYVNPKISSFEFDAASYEDISSSHTATMSFDYEGIVWKAHNTEINDEIMATLYEPDSNGYNKYVEETILTADADAVSTNCNPKPDTDKLANLHAQQGQFGSPGNLGLPGISNMGSLDLLLQNGINTELVENNNRNSVLGAFGNLDFGESISTAIYEVVSGVAAGRSLDYITRNAVSRAGVYAASEILGQAGLPQIISGSVQRSIDLAIRQRNSDRARDALILGAINQLASPIAQRAASRSPRNAGSGRRTAQVIDNAIRQLGTRI